MARAGLVEGRSGIVVGAASGIGEASARLMAAEGASGIVLSDVAGDRLRAVADELHSAHPDLRIETAVVDVTDPEQVDAAVEQALQLSGRLDFAVNSAGITGRQMRLGEYEHAEWRRVVGVNLDGTFNCLSAELRRMGVQKGGAIVNVSSGAAVRPPANLAAYAATKFGISGLTRVAAADYAGDGVRINAVLPGSTLTPLWLGSLGENKEEALARAAAAMPMGRVGTAAEVAELIVWLCSDRASFVNGAEYLVDGAKHAFAQMRSQFVAQVVSSQRSDAPSSSRTRG